MKDQLPGMLSQLQQSLLIPCKTWTICISSFKDILLVLWFKIWYKLYFRLVFCAYFTVEMALYLQS